MSNHSPLYRQSINRTLLEAKEAAKRAIQTNNILMLWGPSGIGKTEMIEDLIASIPKCMQITLSLGSRDPLDFTGIPSLRDGRTVNNDPVLVPLATDKLPDGVEKVIVYIDELPEGDTPTLKAIYRLLNERMVNNSPVHPNVRFIASGNPPSAGAQTEKLIPTVANRMQHILVNICHKEWIKWATKAGISPVQRAFIANYPQYLSNYEKVKDDDDDAFATPRTHARLHAYMNGDSFTDNTLIAQGAPIQFLGKAAGSQLLQFAAATDLPDMDLVLRDPSSLDIESLSPGSMFLLGQSIISLATPTNFSSVAEVINMLPANHKALTFLGLTSLPLKQAAALMRVPAYNTFIQDNLGLLTIAQGD